MSEHNNPKPPEFLPPHDGRMWTAIANSVEAHYEDMPLEVKPLFDREEDAEFFASQNDCRAVEVHVERADLWEKKILGLIDRINAIDFGRGWEVDEFYSDVMKHFGLDDAWFDRMEKKHPEAFEKEESDE